MSEILEFLLTVGELVAMIMFLVALSRFRRGLRAFRDTDVSVRIVYRKPR